MSASGIPIAVATHAARDVIGAAPADLGAPWPGLESLLDWAAATGFDGLDVSTSVFDVERPVQWWRGVESHVGDRGLNVASVNCLRSSLADPDHWRLGDRRIRRAIEIADELGIPSVNISLAVPPERLDANAHRQEARPPGSSRTATADEWTRTIERLRAIDRDTAGRSTRLVLELHHCSVIDTSSALRRLIDEVGGGYTANPDIVNEIWAFDTIDSSADRIVDDLAALSPHLWHVKNYRLAAMPHGRSAFDDAGVGDGEIDYADALARMRAAGFHGWISIERSGPGDFLTRAREGLAFLRTHLSSLDARSTT